MKTITLPEWTIEHLASLAPGERMLVVIPAPRMDYDPRTKRKRRHVWAYHIKRPENILQWGRAPWRKTDPYNFTIEHEAPCPLGAVGERIAVVHPDNWAAVVYAGTSKGKAAAYIALTAEPEVKRVGDMTEEEACGMGYQPRNGDGHRGYMGALGSANCIEGPRACSSPNYCFRHRWERDGHPWPDAPAWFCWMEVVE